MSQLTYVIRAGALGPIKVGTSQDPEARLRQLQTASPRPLTIIGIITDECESMIHGMLNPYRMRGEWFHATPHVCEILSVYDIHMEPTPPARIGRTANVTWNDYLELVRMGLANEPSWQPHDTPAEETA